MASENPSKLELHVSSASLGNDTCSCRTQYQGPLLFLPATVKHVLPCACSAAAKLAAVDVQQRAKRWLMHDVVDNHSPSLEVMKRQSRFSRLALNAASAPGTDGSRKSCATSRRDPSGLTVAVTSPLTGESSSPTQPALTSSLANIVCTSVRSSSPSTAASWPPMELHTLCASCHVAPEVWFCREVEFCGATPRRSKHVPLMQSLVVALPTCACSGASSGHPTSLASTTSSVRCERNSWVSPPSDMVHG
mmetsp:Transcript_28295/g.57939  ORF Transcript_28295/g.57939 Transcript_28295/m.57939 type:complete len:249 (-) Transcript_28295:110-856(-)